MQGQGTGRQRRLLGKLLGKLRGEHRGAGRRDDALPEDGISGGLYSRASSTVDSNFDIEDDLSTQGASAQGASAQGASTQDTPSHSNTQGPSISSQFPFDAQHFAANIDQRYGGQYLTPEQLPEFCNQLHNLVEVVRNIQSFAKVTGEYPTELERRLEREAGAVAALCSEARAAQEAAARAAAQSRALADTREHVLRHLQAARDNEVRELESAVRLSDRKLYKAWEALKDSTDPAAFEPLLAEIRSKQSALECLTRLVESRRRPPPPPPALPAPRADYTATPRRGNKRRRRELARPTPLSEDTSRHEHNNGVECTSRYRVGSTGAFSLTPMEIPSRGSVRDIVFFSIT